MFRAKHSLSAADVDDNAEELLKALTSEGTVENEENERSKVNSIEEEDTNEPEEREFHKTKRISMRRIKPEQEARERRGTMDKGFMSYAMGGMLSSNRKDDPLLTHTGDTSLASSLIFLVDIPSPPFSVLLECCFH